MGRYETSHNLGAFLARIKWEFLLAFVLVGSGCGLFRGFGPVDENRENITLEEAQGVAPFTICLPIDLPAGLDQTPRVSYHADWGDPIESEVRLRYYGSDSQELIVEIRQRPQPGSATPEDLAEQAYDFYVRELVAWVVGWQVGWSNVDEISKEATTSVTTYQDDGAKRWLFEIVEPASLRANMVYWRNESVAYEVYTYLSVEEAKRIVESIPADTSDCEMEQVN